MLKIKLLMLVLFSFIISASAQKQVNDFKYIIVPSQYEFQKNAGDFQLNELTKFLFIKYDFKALLSTEVFPKDLGQNKCLALTAHLRKKSSLFTTKMKYELVNCYNEIVFTSVESSSKNKDYERAYHEAIKKTFESIKTLNYKYSVIDEIVFEEKAEVIENKVSIKEEKLVDRIEESEIVVEVIDKPELVNKEINSNLLYAQETTNGYQLVDNTPKLIYNVQTTSVKDVYIIKNKNGILFKQNGKWFVEYYSDNTLIKKELFIKF